MRKRDSCAVLGHKPDSVLNAAECAVEPIASAARLVPIPLWSSELVNVSKRVGSSPCKYLTGLARFMRRSSISKH